MAEYMQKSNSFVGLDILKTAAIIGVILNHILPHRGVWISFLYYFGIYMAVPVFMVISGFLFSYVCEKKHTTTLFSYFAPKIFFKRLLTYGLPFFIILAGECFFLHCYSIQFVLKLILTGGVLASGSFYIPVFFQFLVIFPFLYQLSNRPQIGTFILLATWLLFEWGMIQIRGGGVFWYRLCFFRYLPFVWGGILLWRYPWFTHFIPRLCILSLLYITLLYTHYKPSLFLGWHMTSGFTAGYAFFLVWLFLKLFQNVPPLPPGLNIGRQTWFIFLFQMFFLKFLKPSLLFAEQSKTKTFACCLLGGVLFFYTYQLLIFLLKKAYNILLKSTRKMQSV